MHYLIHIWRDIEPVRYGPFETPEDRDVFAHRLYLLEGKDSGGMFPLDMIEGEPEVGQYGDLEYTEHKCLVGAKVYHNIGDDHNIYTVTSISDPQGLVVAATREDLSKFTFERVDIVLVVPQDLK